MRIIVMTNPNPNRSGQRNEAVPKQGKRSKSAPRKPATRFTLPDLPRAQWCDIRASYI